MKVGAIIAEYNPFHNGHKYQIMDFKRQSGCDYVIAVMSGCFVQRGEFAIADKFTRARWAVKNGIDMVVELPVYYVLRNAEGFARGAVMTIEAMGIVSALGFGSEIDDVKALSAAADIRVDDVKFESNGKSYPRALSEAISENVSSPLVRDVFINPNATLGVEYIRAIKNYAQDLDFFVTKRVGAGHDSGDIAVHDGIKFASASHIRGITGSGTEAELVPDDVASELKKSISHDDISNLLLFNLRRMSDTDYGALPDVTEGIEWLLKKNAMTCTSYDMLLGKMKSKRYTMARIKRLCMASLIGITDEIAKSNPSYIRVLAAREDSFRKLVGTMTKKASVPLIIKGTDVFKINDYSQRMLLTDYAATDLYSLVIGKKAGQDLSQKFNLIK